MDTNGVAVRTSSRKDLLGSIMESRKYRILRGIIFGTSKGLFIPADKLHEVFQSMNALEHSILEDNGEFLLNFGHQCSHA